MSLVIIDHDHILAYELRHAVIHAEHVRGEKLPKPVLAGSGFFADGG